MNLFAYGLDLCKEPNVWDVFPDIKLRVYTGTRYFATWDFGACFGIFHDTWPIMKNLDRSWDFDPSFVEGGESLFYEVEQCN